MIGVPAFLGIGLMLAIFMVRSSLSVLLLVFRTIELLLIWLISIFLLKLRTVIGLFLEGFTLIIFPKGWLISIRLLFGGIIFLFGIRGRIAVGLNPGSGLLGFIVGLITSGGFFLFSVIWEQEVKRVGFGIDLNAGFDKGGSGHAQSLDGVPHEHTVMDMPAATGRGFILKDSDVYS